MRDTLAAKDVEIAALNIAHRDMKILILGAHVIDQEDFKAQIISLQAELEKERDTNSSSLQGPYQLL